MKIQKPKVLIVDDNLNNRKAMSHLLARLNCQTITASSGNEALSLCIEHDFALVLLDVDMPEMDGYEMANLLKEEPSTQHFPIIYVTATFHDQEHMIMGYEAGAVDYLYKPVNEVVLLSKVSVFIELYNNRQLAHRELERSESMRIVSAENENRFRGALVDAPIPVMLHAEDGQVILLNRVWTQLTGYSKQDIPTVNAWLLKAYGAENLELMKKVVQGLFENTQWRSREQKIRTREGKTLIWVFTSSLVAPLTDGRQLMMSMASDITERKQFEEQLQLANLVYENSSEGMMITDPDGRIVSVNPAFTTMLGYRGQEVIGQFPRYFRSGRHDKAFYQAMWHDLNSKGFWQGEIWNKRKNGEHIAEWLTINTICSEDGSILKRVGLFSDITKKKQDEEIIWRQANFDSLTGLANRRMFQERLEIEIKESQREEFPFALIFLDLDEFKAVNDMFGHDMGDELLKQAALRLLDCVRVTDVVCRLGGDEFTIIITRLNRSISVERVAQGIIDSLSTPFLLGEHVAHVSASVGITIFPDDANDIDRLLKNADHAMYAAKNKGRHCYSYFTPAMQQETEERLRISNDLRKAVSEQQFILYYQPIIELKTGVVEKAEALLRWQHPKLGLVSPDDFISIAEETGLINPIGDWVFYQAVEQVISWRTKFNHNFQVSINKSPVQFTSSNDEHAAWLNFLNEKNIPGNSLIVEITETLLLDINCRINDKLLNFRDQGIQVCIDDFGTGYSSLSYLQKLDIDYLKIDKSFTHNLTEHSSELALCLAIITMAHKLGLKVVAEGVETEQQRDLLMSMNCDYVQGYLYAKPLSVEHFEAFFKKNNVK